MTVSVWGMIPSTESSSMITPSMARIARVTSPPKSTWPGVSIRLIRYWPPSKSWTIDAIAALIVMPRACDERVGEGGVVDEEALGHEILRAGDREVVNPLRGRAPDRLDFDEGNVVVEKGLHRRDV